MGTVKPGCHIRRPSPVRADKVWCSVTSWRICYSVVQWSKHPLKIDSDKFKCLLILELVVANSKHLNFPLLFPKLDLIHISQKVMEDFHFHR